MATGLFILLAALALVFLAKAAFVFFAAAALPRTGGALFVPTTGVRVEAFLDAVPMGPETFLVDLGCGDGRVLMQAFKRYGMRGEGYEVNLMAYGLSRLRFLGNRRVRVFRKNFFLEDLGRADVVFCYLFPDVMKPLAEKLQAELKPGALAASANFPLPGWTPETVLHPQGSLHSDPIYLYRQKD